MALIAALEALCDLERHGLIRIHRMAGTSAGALAAAFYARGMTDPKADPDRPRANRLEDLESFLRGLKDQLAGERGRKLAKEFRCPLYAIPYRALRFWFAGRPLWRDRELQKWLYQEFGQLSFAKLNLPVSVVTTVLGAARHEIREKASPIAQALLDSAGLPFLFRNWTGSGEVFVDGGLCNNLPVQCLLQDRDTFESSLQLPPNQRLVTFAISFEQEFKEAPRSALQFAKGLLLAPIDDSVIRARAALGDPNLVLCLETSLKTFDFSKAFSKDYVGTEGDKNSGTEYRSLKQQTSKFVHALTARERLRMTQRANTNLNPSYWTEPDHRLQVVMETVFKSYLRHHSSTSIRLIEFRYEIIAWALLDPKLPCVETVRCRFAAVSAPIYASSTFFEVGSSNEHFSQTTVLVTAGDGAPVGHTVLPLRNPAKPEHRGVLVNYLTPLQVGAGEYTEIITDKAPKTLEYFSKLNFNLEQRFDVENAIIEVLVHVPLRAPKHKLTFCTSAEDGRYGRPMPEDRITVLRGNRIEELAQTSSIGWTNAGRPIREIRAEIAVSGPAGAPTPHR